MNLLNLIEEASRAKGSAMELARCMKKAPARITEWKKGRAKPDAGEVAYMAKAAGLPVLITVAMIEAELHPEKAEIWKEALGELKGGRPTPRKEKKRAKVKEPGTAGFFHECIKRRVTASGKRCGGPHADAWVPLFSSDQDCRPAGGFSATGTDWGDSEGC